MPDSTLTAVKRDFESTFGYAPAGVWSAPGRVNLIGEHTDYNEGFVFPFAINRRTYAAIGQRTDNLIRVASSFSPEIHEVALTAIKRDDSNDWAAYPFGAAWAIQQTAKTKGIEINPTGFDCFIESDVPVGAGLSSSAALECAVALALNELWAVGLDRRDLARELGGALGGCPHHGAGEGAGGDPGRRQLRGDLQEVVQRGHPLQVMAGAAPERPPARPPARRLCGPAVTRPPS